MDKNNKKLDRSLIWFSVSLVFLFSVSLVQPVKAEGASLYLSPVTGTFIIGSTFDVSVFVNTNDNNVNAVKVDLQFDPKKLQIASPAGGKSFISVWVSQPSYSNTKGTASFQGGVPSPGINSSSALVSTITFRAVSPGEAVISISGSSQVLLDDGKGTDILSSAGQGEYYITIPPPEGPKVVSSTHPDQNKWYKNNTPVFSWDIEQGVTDFSYAIDRDFRGIPDNISEGSDDSISYADLDNGIWYFHIKAKKENNWGGITHYLIQVDSDLPAEFNLRFEPDLNSPVTVSKRPIVFFITTDHYSGIDHYEFKIINLSETLEKDESGFFVEALSPYKLPVLAAGEYELIVRAYDKAGNWQETSARVDVIPSDKFFYISKRGVNIYKIYLNWKKMALILFFIVFLVLIIFVLKCLSEKNFFQRINSLKKIKEKIKKESEKLNKKINE